MFSVIPKEIGSFDIDMLHKIETVYHVKTDHETNQLMFLFYNRETGEWVYRPANDYNPVEYVKNLFQK